ncbi:MAG: alpha/beta hydrolase [Candidatus Omnitrophica bacterium]|nr:alpha/beta hydrolase [Candidatus Omnitrophota bacterium]
MERFKYVDRGYDETVVLLAGWATDYRIFAGLDLRFNYLLLVDESYRDFSDDLVCMIKKIGLSKVSLFGCSLGGYRALDFSISHNDLVDNLFLIGMRKRYQPTAIEKIKQFVTRGKKGYLSRFYRDCFYRPESVAQFKEDLSSIYYDKFSVDYLIDGLDYLAKSRIDPQDIPAGLTLVFVHGREDKIAPIKDVFELKEQISGSITVVCRDSGHFPFWDCQIGELL